MKLATRPMAVDADAFYQKRVPQGRARLGRDRPHRLPQRPHRRRGLPDRAGDRRLVRATSAPSPSTPGRCAAPTSTTPTSCASTSTRSRAPTSPTRCGSPRVAREVLDELGWRGFPKTSGNRGVHIYVRIEPRWTFTDVRHAAIAFGRELERRMPGQVTTKWWKEERGETDLRRLQPERARPHHRLGLLGAAAARTPRSRRR